VAADDDEPPEWLARYEGLSVEDAVALAGEESRPVRVLRPDDAMTMEWRPDRVNVFLDEEGAVRRVSRG
jgi:peptidase inhibitor I78 family protein